MIFARLPDPQDPAAPSAYPWNRQTIVVHDRTRNAVYGRHSAPFSLKTVLAGAEHYDVHGFVETVEPGEAIIVNNGQSYESAIDARMPVETLCVFFSDEDARDALRAGTNQAKLLDDPDLPTPAIEVAGVKRRLDRAVGQMLLALPRLRQAPILARQEHCARLLQAILAWEKPHWDAASQLDSLRASTRTELYRRCLIASACIDACYADDLSLARLSFIAGLSRTHFLRAFKACFGETPYQTLRRRRLERAAELLRRRLSVTDAAVAVGYSDFSAFARAFRRFHGASPSAYPG